MPTYVYQCEDGTTFEYVQRMSDDPLTVCPSTGQSVKRKISSGAGLIFKGAGFYETDYVRKPSTGDGASTETTSDAKTTDAPSVTETKTAPASTEET